MTFIRGPGNLICRGQKKAARWVMESFRGQEWDQRAVAHPVTEWSTGATPGKGN